MGLHGKEWSRMWDAPHSQLYHFTAGSATYRVRQNDVSKQRHMPDPSQEAGSLDMMEGCEVDLQQVSRAPPRRIFPLRPFSGGLLALRWRYHTGCTLGSSYVPQHIQTKPRQESKPADSMYLKYVMKRSRCVRFGPEANRRFQVLLPSAQPFASLVARGATATQASIAQRHPRCIFPGWGSFCW